MVSLGGGSADRSAMLIYDDFLGHLDGPAIGSCLRPPAADDAGGVVKRSLRPSNQTFPGTDDRSGHVAADYANPGAHSPSDRRARMLLVRDPHIVGTGAARAEHQRTERPNNRKEA
jgi:hypothetical protein